MPKRALGCTQRGPGLGVVTDELLRRGAQVTAVEKDHRLAAWLGETFAEAMVSSPFPPQTAREDARPPDPLPNDCPNREGEPFDRLTVSSRPRELLHLIEADALEVDFDALLATRFDAMVSNLPYSVGTRILLDVAMHALAPPIITVTVQLEVAERFAAQARADARGQAGVWLQRLYDVEIVRIIKPTCFWPKPEISSALVRLARHDRYALSVAESALYLELTRHAFLHRRKQLASALRLAPEPLNLETAVIQEMLSACGADPRARAEELDVAQWCALVRMWPG